MIKIKYNNQETFEEVSFSKLSENLVALKGTTKNTSGFSTYRLSGEQLGDFSDFTTVYKIEDDTVYYSNNDTVFEEAEYEPVEYVEQPTQLDRIEAQCLFTALMTDTLLEE